jgi:Cu+-exporting ATPase
MSALSSPFTAGFWYKNSLINSGSGKVELPLVENEPLDKSLGHVERCELRIEGMTCGACVEVSSLSSPIAFDLQSPPQKSIEGMLRSQPGIYSVKVALLAERGVVEFDPQQWTAEKVINVSNHHTTTRFTVFTWT